MSEKLTSILTSKWAYAAAGILVGALIILGIRFITYANPAETHFHANFAVYINGEREDFKEPRYYEEVTLCHAHDTITPQMRTHMHNQENGVIHVHDDGVTWGHFFANIGWTLGQDFMRTPDKLYVADAENDLNVVLNGQNLTGISSIANQLIDDKDRLLISYGDADKQTLDKQYEVVPNNAEEYNNKPDPAGCGGAVETTFSDRLQHLL